MLLARPLPARGQDVADARPAILAARTSGQGYEFFAVPSTVRRATMAGDRNTGLETNLLARTAQGDQEAFESLFRRFERPLYAYFLRMLQDRATAEDLVCETMTVVWKGARQYRAEGRVSTWIFGIAHNMAAGVLRRKRPTVSLEDIAEMPSEDTPEEAAERLDQTDRVRRAVAALPPEHREVVELTFYQGFSYPEIAKILDIPVNTVKTRMFYGRQKLKAHLESLGVVDVT